MEIMLFVISGPSPIPFLILIPMSKFQCRDLQMALKTAGEKKAGEKIDCKKIITKRKRNKNFKTPSFLCSI